MIENINKITPEYLSSSNVVFVCVGTNRITGDCLGPYVGSLLKDRGYNVYGTMNNPVHANNLCDLTLPEDKFVITIDSGVATCWREVGEIVVSNMPLAPGCGVGKELPEIGDMSIIGYVIKARTGKKVVSNLDLALVPFSLVADMAYKIVQQIDTVFSREGFDTVITYYRMMTEYV